ncbi:MAG: hypothetical protein WDM80_08235 [Limisphaerales bacterium]
MNETILKERTKRLLEINGIIKKLDETIRPAAFLLLQDYVLSVEAPVKNKQSPSTPNDNLEEDREGFFAKHDHEKPSENGLLLSAYHYSQFGASSFTIDEMEALANEVGVTIPERLDMTFLQAKRNGKNLFLRAGKKAFRPTVHGETFFKATYQVSKGKQQKQQLAE